MTPTLIERADGLGWLAATPDEHAYRIAVTAPSWRLAVERLKLRVAAWDALSDEPPETTR